MKISKKTWLVIVIGIFVVVGIGLNMVRSQQVQQQDELNAEFALTQLNLSRLQLEQLSSRQAELESQLSQATSQSEAVKAMFSQPIGSVAATTILFDIAKAHGVEVTEMTSSGLASDSLEGVTYSVISLAAKVEGDVPNLVSFVTKLNSYFTTGVVKSITITIPETTSGDNVTALEITSGDNVTALETTTGERASADIQLVVYTYQEASDGEASDG